MSNLKNIFGNAGWIQSAIDKSRGKSRPGERNRRKISRDMLRREETLKNDPLVQKQTTGRGLASHNGILKG